MSSAWITWEHQRRNTSLSSELGARLYEISSRHTGFRRYLDCILKTYQVIRNEDFKRIFVQNPSIVLACFAVIATKWHGRELIVDAHNAGIFPREGRSKVLQAVSAWINRRASFVVVSNEALGKVVTSQGGRCLVLPDPLPPIKRTKLRVNSADKFSILFVCTWAVDEPVDEVIKAAKLLPDGFVIYFTGRIPKRYLEIALDKVVLLGFIEESEYIARLSSSDLIIDLTTRDDCLVCGAYESLALAKPMLLSDSNVNRTVFRNALFTNNMADDIASKITIAAEGIEKYQRLSESYRAEFSESWERQKQCVMTMLNRKRE